MYTHIGLLCNDVIGMINVTFEIGQYLTLGSSAHYSTAT